MVRVILLVAGRSTRMQSITGTMPKSFLKIGKEPLIHRNIRLLRQAGVSKITLVTGYKAERFKQEFGDLDFVVNPDYATTNTGVSLFLALNDAETDDILVMNGDVYVDDGIIEDVLKYQGKTMAAVKRHDLSDEEIKVIRDGNRVLRIGKYIEESKAYGEAFGIYLLTAKFARYLKRSLYLLNNPRAFYEMGMDVLLQGGHDMGILDVGDRIVQELDFPRDYQELLDLLGEKNGL